MGPAIGLPLAALQDLAGTWVGQWERDGSILEVQVTFSRTASGYEGSFTSEQLRVVRIPFRRIHYEEPKVSWELVGDRTTAIFDGSVQADTLVGRFRDGDAVGTFRLTRGTSVADSFVEEEIAFANGAVGLSGTVILPSGAGPFPGIVFLHGSGAEGRWASRYLANAFVRHGVAALVYDKRGVGTSTGDWRAAGFAELVGDAGAAIEALRSRPRIDPDRVGVHGHSQGGTIVPAVAAANHHVSFLVASAAAGMSMAETEIYSLANAVGLHGLPEAEKRLAEAYIHAVVDVAYKGAPRSLVEKTWRDFRDRPWIFPLPTESDSYWSFSRRIASYDPLASWRQVSCPVLLVYGEEDQRVPPRASAAKIADAYLGSHGSRLDVVIFPGADHTFRLPPDSPKTFQWPRTVPGYPDRVIEWALQVLKP
jgi:dipeptidyl aminopeptidase/acylaminoacyl peptidase